MNFAIWDVLILVFVCRRDDKPSANQWWPNSMAHIYVIRSQWVKSYFRFDDHICNNEVSHAIKWWRNTVAESCFNGNAWEQSNSRFWLLKYSDTKYASRYLNRLILQIPQCTNSISHNAPFFSRNVYVSVTKWSIVGYLSDKETSKLCIIGPARTSSLPSHLPNFKQVWVFSTIWGVAKSRDTKCYQILSGLSVLHHWCMLKLPWNTCPDSKVHGAIMVPIWGRQDPGGPHVGLTKFAIWPVTWTMCGNAALATSYTVKLRYIVEYYNTILPTAWQKLSVCKTMNLR